MFKSFEMELAGRPLVIETGKYAELAGGAVIDVYKRQGWSRAGRRLLKTARSFRGSGFISRTTTVRGQRWGCL